MKTLLHQAYLPFKLSVVSLIIAIFLTDSANKCGSARYGLPLRFIRSKCGCAEHVFPIDFLNLGVDILYHMIIWGVVVYLWNDAKDTWKMIRNRKYV